jgi:hypothetical protein
MLGDTIETVETELHSIRPGATRPRQQNSENGTGLEELAATLTETSQTDLKKPN